jgi:cyclophilin family peptidyl-prolyl cis-trans isomerase
MTRLSRLLVAITAIVAAASIAACGPGATPSASAPAASTPASAGGSQATTDCPTKGPEPMAAGEQRVVTIETSKGPIEILVEADLGPLAAQNFVDLAACGFYDGVVFHRVVPGFVIQGGDGQYGRASQYDPNLVGTGGPGYEFGDDPVGEPYNRAVVAMANSGPNTNGSQFFIVLDDAGLDPAYSVFGHVTSGMEAVDAIAAAADAQKPTDPIVMDRVTVAQP